MIPLMPTIEPVLKTSRDAWCTPKWLSDALGTFDVDPCSNEFSHIEAFRNCILELGDDGLLSYPVFGFYRRAGRTDRANSGTRTFINPPYSRGQVIKWVRHWLDTDFTFLLRWDPSTEWFKLLMTETSSVWFPDKRLNFEPPPGVKASTNPFPHALFFRNDPPSEVCAKLNQLGRFFKPCGRGYQ